MFNYSKYCQIDFQRWLYRFTWSSAVYKNFSCSTSLPAFGFDFGFGFHFCHSWWVCRSISLWFKFAFPWWIMMSSFLSVIGLQEILEWYACTWLLFFFSMGDFVFFLICRIIVLIFWILSSMLDIYI